MVSVCSTLVQFQAVHEIRALHYNQLKAALPSLNCSSEKCFLKELIILTNKFPNRAIKENQGTSYNLLLKQESFVTRLERIRNQQELYFTCTN